MNGKISTRQAWLLSSVAIVSSEALYMPAYLMQAAGRDAWLALILAMLIGFPTAILVVLPGLRFPGQNFVQYCEYILGKIPGKLAAFLFVLSYLIILATTCRELSDLLLVALFPHTPIIVLIGSMSMVSAYAVNRGIEAIARVGEIVAVIVFGAIYLVVLMSIKDASFSNLAPVLEKGWRPLLSGISVQMPFLPQMIVVAFLLDKLDRPAAAIKATLGYVLLAGFTFTVIVTVVVGVSTSEYAAVQMAPMLTLARTAEISFITRNEALVIGLWVLGSLVRFSLFYYLVTSTLGQVFGLQDYRHITLPVGLIAAVSSIMMFTNIFELNRFITGVLAVYHPILFIGFPALLLAAAVIRKKGEPTLPVIRRAYQEITDDLASFTSSIKRVYYSIVMPAE